METSIRIRYILFVFFFILMSCGTKNCKTESNFYAEEVTENSSISESSCDFNTASLIGALYVLSCPSLTRDESDLENVVSEIAYLLHEDGDIIKYMRRLGELMAQRGTQNFNFNNAQENQVRENVIEMATEAGMADQAGAIAENLVTSMRNEQLQPIIIGNELIWLSEVLPAAAEGDWYDYNNTGSIFRKQALAQIAQIKQVLIIIGSTNPEDARVLGHILPIVDQWSHNYGVGFIMATGIHLGIFK